MEGDKKEVFESGTVIENTTFFALATYEDISVFGSFNLDGYSYLYVS